MPGQRPILAMSFVASLGITLEIAACKFPRGEGNYWPLIIYVFYFILLITMILSKRVIKDTSMYDTSSKSLRDYAVFFAAGIMVSTMALPIVLTLNPVEKPVIAPLSCFLVELGNILCLATIASFYMYFKSHEQM